MMNVLEKGTLFTHPIENKGKNKIRRFLSRSQHNEEAMEVTNTEGSKSDIHTDGYNGENLKSSESNTRQRS